MHAHLGKARGINLEGSLQSVMSSPVRLCQALDWHPDAVWSLCVCHEHVSLIRCRSIDHLLL